MDIQIFQSSPLSLIVSIILLISVMGILVNIFFNKDNKEAEVELNILDKLKFKLRTTK